MFSSRCVILFFLLSSIKYISIQIQNLDYFFLLIFIIWILYHCMDICINNQKYVKSTKSNPLLFSELIWWYNTNLMDKISWWIFKYYINSIFFVFFVFVLRMSNGLAQWQNNFYFFETNNLILIQILLSVEFLSWQKIWKNSITFLWNYMSNLVLDK